MPLLDLHAGRSLTRGGLTITPLWSGRAVSDPGYDVRSTEIDVAERTGSPVVSELVVTNRGRRPVLLLEGELLRGGWQNRVTARSAVVEPGQPAVVPVRCVERRRWTGSGGQVRDGRRAPVTLRAARGQAETWDAVTAYETRYARSATSSFHEAAEPALASARALVRGVLPLPFQTGVVLSVGGNPLLMECYDSPRTLNAVWLELLRAVALDALHAAPVPTPGRRVRRFLDRVAAVPTQAVDGQLCGETPYARLEATIWHGRPVVSTAVHARHELVAA